MAVEPMQTEQSTIVLAYWAPVYVTVDTTRREVTRVQLVASGMRSSARVTGQPSDGRAREADRIFAAARAEKGLPAVELG